MLEEVQGLPYLALICPMALSIKMVVMAILVEVAVMVKEGIALNLIPMEEEVVVVLIRMVRKAQIIPGKG